VFLNRLTRREQKGKYESPRILVADDHEVVRRGMVSILEAQAAWEVCAEVSNGREAVIKPKN
jgi:DNA-binding NarL/FixJ family response regulator